MERIIIIGYMGAGKTTLGRVLAAELGLQFYDLDRYIEERMRKTIPQIFDERGEDGFRLIERNMLHEAAEFEDVVLSCGGGTPCFFDNMEYINRQGETVYLKAEPEVLYAHMGMGKVRRPLLQGKTQEETMAFMKDHLMQREPYYMQAKHVLNVNLLDKQEKIKTTVDTLRKMLNIKTYSPDEEMDY